MSNLKKTHWLRTTIIVLLVCGIAGLALSFFQFRAESAPASASAKIRFSFEKAAEGIGPDGMPFDLSALTTENVISAGLEAAGLQDRYTVDQIRENLTVSGEYPATYLEQMTKYVSLLTEGADTEQTVSANYFPTQYTVELSSDFDTGIASSQLTELLAGILEAYRNGFIREHSLIPMEEPLEKALADYDYPQQLEAISEISAQQQRYAAELEELTDDFTSGGISFGDIAVKYQVLDTDIDRLNAQITLNVVSKDRERLQKRYEMEIRDQSIELASRKEELKQIEEMVEAYEKEGIIYVSSNGSLQKVGSNTSTTYDKLVAKRKEVADSIAATNARIALYQSRLDDMTGAAETTGTAAQETAEPAATAAPETASENAAPVEAATTDELASVVAEVSEIAVSEQTEEDVAKLNDAMDQRIRRLLDKEDGIEEQFAALQKAYSEQKLNTSTVAVTTAKYSAPKILSGSFVSKALKTVGPICVVGLMVCLALLIISRIREQKQKKQTLEQN